MEAKDERMEEGAAHVMRGEGRSLWIFGELVTYKVTAEQTGGAYSLFEVMSRPEEGGPPPHVQHREEEAFYVLEGEITFTVEAQTLTGGPGTFVQIPRGTPHAFRNNSASPARMLIQCTPSGFDRFMAEFATELPSPGAPPFPPSREEIEKLLELAPKYGIVMLPPPES